MNLYIGLYGFGLIRDIRHMIKHYLITSKSPNSIPYLSQLLSKIQLSIEIAIDIIVKEKEKSWEIKKYIITLFEVLIVFFKFRELQQLKSKDFDFYLSSDLYYSEVLMIDEDKYNSKLKEHKDITNEFSIKNKKSKEMFKPISSKFLIPEKILKEANKKSNSKLTFKEDNKECIIKVDHTAEDKNKENQENVVLLILSMLRQKESRKELLFIIKPLVYLLSIFQFSKDSTYPTIIIFILDILTKGKRTNNLEGTFSQKYLFNLEQAKRSSKYVIYLLRNPIFSYFTKPILQKLFSIIRLSDSFSSSIIGLLENLYLHYLIK